MRTRDDDAVETYDEWLARHRAASGVPPRVVDVDVLDRVAAITTAAAARVGPL